MLIRLTHDSLLYHLCVWQNVVSRWFSGICQTFGGWGNSSLRRVFTSFRSEERWPAMGDLLHSSAYSYHWQISWTVMLVENKCQCQYNVSQRCTMSTLVHWVKSSEILSCHDDVFFLPVLHNWTSAMLNRVTSWCIYQLADGKVFTWGTVANGDWQGKKLLQNVKVKSPSGACTYKGIHFIYVCKYYYYYYYYYIISIPLIDLRYWMETEETVLRGKAQPTTPASSVLWHHLTVLKDPWPLKCFLCKARTCKIGLVLGEFVRITALTVINSGTASYWSARLQGNVREWICFGFQLDHTHGP